MPGSRVPGNDGNAQSPRLVSARELHHAEMPSDGHLLRGRTVLYMI